MTKKLFGVIIAHMSKAEIGNEAYSGVNYVNPQDFLAVFPKDQVEIGALIQAPSKQLLMQLPDQDFSVGMAYSGGIWAMVKVGDDRGIPSYLMPNRANVLIHSHPKHDDEEEKPSQLPSAGAFLNSSETAVNLVVSPKGITRFWKTEGIQAQIQMNNAVWSKELHKRDAYIEFLKEVGARYEVYPWEEIDDARLSEIFSGK